MSFRFATLFPAVIIAAALPALASAQVTPAAGYTPPDDTPAIHVGLTLFPTFVVQSNPEITDADGNLVKRNAFDVARAYINLTGNISHLIAFRLTPDITRESGLLTLGTGSSVSNDSLVFRIKYAYAQFNFDDWMTRGSWARLGIQQTPWVDFEEGIYRYRFQGTVFAERIPLPTAMTSSDAGISFHYNLPSNYGDFHIGVYNGENYQRVEVNDQKALEFRGTLRPFATNQPLRGLRAHFVYYNDHYAGDDERKRVMGNVTFEHRFLNAGFDYLSGKDKTLATATAASSEGYSVWATPRAPMANGSSWEGLLRFDHFTPNTARTIAPASTSPFPGTTLLHDQHQDRRIFGIAYWFPHQGNVTTAILVDYDGQRLDNITTAPVRTVSVHGLVNFRKVMLMKTIYTLAIAAGLASTLAVGAAAQQTIQITGAGATFPYPIYSKWFSDYNKARPNIQINYQSIGSGGGIRQLTNQTVFFGATDGPMTNEQLLAAPGKILHFPTVLGADVPVYNLPSVKAELKFTGALLADIFLGKVTKWNDPAISKLNAGITLPDTDITVVHRADGSGTTYIWVDYLAKVSPEWKTKVGVSTSVNWPTGVGGKGNEGVAGLVSQTPGSIGYVELIYALQNKISYGTVQNMAGEFMKASVDSVTAAAAEAATKMPADFRVSITNAPGKGVYPVSSFTWLLLYENPKDKAQAKVMVDFVKWALADGQKFAADLGYAPLPEAVVKLELVALAKIKIS